MASPMQRATSYAPPKKGGSSLVPKAWGSTRSFSTGDGEEDAEPDDRSRIYEHGLELRVGNYYKRSRNRSGFNLGSNWQSKLQYYL